MPDISMICFKFRDLVHFRNWTNKVGKILIHPRRFVGFNWNMGNLMTFKVLQGSTNTHKHNMVVHRGVVVLNNLTTTGYNSALAPNSDAYSPEVYLESAHPRKPATPGSQVTVDPPDISIAEGRRKRNKHLILPSVTGINQVKVD